MQLAVIMSLYKNDTVIHVKEAVKSLFYQTFPEFDLYIQFDGPVQKEVESYIDGIQKRNVYVLRREVNKGLAFSLNELLNVVLDKGYSYIARMDADDISMPERFEKQITYMEQHPEIDCLGTWAIEIDAGGNEYFRKQMPVNHDECLNFFKKRDCMIHPTVMFRRSYFEKAGLYPEDTYFGEDTMMWAKGFRAGCQFANLPDHLFKFRLDENFFQRRRGWKHAKSIFTLRKKVNKTLNFGIQANLYACLYALAKLMPEKLLNLIYRFLR